VFSTRLSVDGPTSGPGQGGFASAAQRCPADEPPAQASRAKPSMKLALSGVWAGFGKGGGLGLREAAVVASASAKPLRASVVSWPSR
jgi:hypothetical protein